MIKDIASAGFNNVHLHTDFDTNEEELFNRLDKIVNDCLDNNVIPIIAFTSGDAEGIAEIFASGYR